MKVTLRIARVELSTLFFSPIAWLVLIVFTFQTGLTFVDKLKLYAGYQEMGSRLSFITSAIFGGPLGLFSEIQRNVYLYIPLLTMGLMSRELSSGSIKLLLSSPVKTREIILGKYLAMMVYCLLLIAILAIFAVAGMYSIQSFDMLYITSGLLGIYLLICAYAAIGLFMSSLTAYQVVAAVSTLVVLAALNYVGLLWQDVNFVRDLTYFLSISGRADQMRDGLIISKDLCYFVLVITLFLGLSIMLLQSGREAKPLWVKIARYSLLTVTVLMLGYISSRPGLALYADMTATKTRTLTATSQQIIKQLKEPLKVTTYVNLMDDFWHMGIPKSRNKDVNFWQPYQRFMPDMKINYVYYYDTSMAEWLYKGNKGVSLDTLAKRMAKARELSLKMFMPPAEIRKIIDLRPEENRFVRCLEYNGKRSFLREYAGEMDPNPGEAEVLAAIKRLVVTPPKIGFLTGNNERAIDKVGDKDYKGSTAELSYRKSLVNQGFDVTALSLEEGDVPEDIAVLVIADPKKTLPPAVSERIIRYIDRGGNMLIAGEPGRQEVLNPLLNKLGVQLKEGILLHESRDFSPDLVMGYITTAAAATSGNYKNFWTDSVKMSMISSVGVQYTQSDFKVTEILATDSSKSWNKTGQLNQDTGYVQFDPSTGDVKATTPIAVSLTRQTKGKEQRIMVLGDADFMSAPELNRYNIRVGNFFFMFEMFKWLSYDEYPVDVSRPKAPDSKILIAKEDVTILRIILLVLLPAVLFISAVALLIRRKRR
ncbi:Gldg family protein [Chitinophaga niabensis]|uniref:ABC-2 type transport system permease protein n=1 Tax=Chitinophaga niabensis TaxID=536979 RepID=A0A1N6GZI9_9BACT|nr:Gldg family protein [Chitinophaga niabensis]SIO12795.1 ABC-2 type transport system permease protein [Chitinophaga niabensis]